MSNEPLNATYALVIAVFAFGMVFGIVVAAVFA